MFESLSLGGLSWKDLAKRVYNETIKDDILGRAAQLSYYFLLALFPSLLFLTTLLAASNGMSAISESLNAAYDLKETRAWWKARLVEIGLTLALSFLIISA